MRPLNAPLPGRGRTCPCTSGEQCQFGFRRAYDSWHIADYIPRLSAPSLDGLGVALTYRATSCGRASKRATKLSAASNNSNCSPAIFHLFTCSSACSMPSLSPSLRTFHHGAGHLTKVQMATTPFVAARQLVAAARTTDAPRRRVEDEVRLLSLGSYIERSITQAGQLPVGVFQRHS